MTIRRIDITASHLVIPLFNKYRIFYKMEPDLELAESFIKARLGNNESVVYVVFDDNLNTPVGITQLYPTFSSRRAIKNWILNDLYVEPEYRKQGIGEKLIKTAMQFAKNDGAKTLQLSTAVDNFTAQSLYEKIGFVRQGLDPDFYDYKLVL